MVDSVFKGGLNYKIVIDDSWDDQLKKFEKRIDALDKRAGVDPKKDKDAAKTDKAGATALANTEKTKRRILRTENDISKQRNTQNKQIKQNNKELKNTEKSVNRVAFTFRRLIGILAVFTIARKLTAAIGGAVNEMSRFNAVMETTRISFAALISSTGQLVDNQGNILTGADEFNRALGLSDVLMKQLRVDALQTVATFEDLLFAFQTAIGPGLTAGLSLEEIREVSVNIAKAATTLGVKTNQLAEEIRALVQGNIRLNTTRLAAIGITNEQIRLAREEGTLFALLSERLEAFAIAGDKTSKTFAGLRSNLQEAMSILLAEGATEYFEQLKAAMLGFTNALQDQREIAEGQEAFGLNEDAVKGVEAVSKAMAGLISDFRGIVDADEAVKGLRTNLEAVGAMITVIGKGLLPIVAGFAKGLTLVSATVVVLYEMGKAIAEMVPEAVVEFFQSTLINVIAITVAVVLWAKTLALVLGTYGAIKAIMLKVVAVQKAIQAAAVALLAITNITLAKEKLIAFWKGVILALSSAWLLVAIAIVAVIATILQKTGVLGRLWDKITKKFDDSLDVTKKIKDEMGDLAGVIASQVGDVDNLTKALKSLEEQTIESGKALQKALALKNLTGNAKAILASIIDAQSFIEKNTREMNKRLENTRKQIQRAREDALLGTSDEELQILKQDLYLGARVNKRVQDRIDMSLQVLGAITSINEKETDTLHVMELQDKEMNRIADVEARTKANFEKALTTVSKIAGMSFEGLSIASAAIAIERIEEAVKARKSLVTLGETEEQQQKDINDFIAKTPGLLENKLKLTLTNLDANKKLADALDAQANLLEKEADILGDTKEAADLRAEAAIKSLEAINVRIIQLNTEAKKLDALMETIKSPLSEDELKNAKDELRDLGIDEALVDAFTGTGLTKEIEGAIAAEQFEIDIKIRDLEISETAKAELAKIEDLKAAGGIRGGLGRFAEQARGGPGATEAATVAALEGGIDAISSGIGDAIRGEQIDPAEMGIDLLATVLETFFAQMLTNFITQLIIGETQTGIMIKIAAVLDYIALLMTKEAVSPLHSGGPVIAAARGGKILGMKPIGFAPGGRVSGRKLPRAPRGAHPNDRIPAVLEQGEYVINAKSASNVGLPLLNALNSSDFSTASAMAPVSAISAPQASFQAGGVVTSAVPTVPTAQQQQNQIPTVLPVLPVDRRFARKVVNMAKSDIMDLVVQNKRRLA
ncbi:MAG: hypothetical protein GY845_25940 [Planctomycetes bacterium]|nr:hypothetical protein [Planctomycetota bacterium]